MVHSAEWTPAMRARFVYANGQPDYKRLLRACGYGTPNFTRLLSSLDNSLTLIAESELEPFLKEDGRIKTREMRPHALPWPVDVLNDLQDTEVTSASPYPILSSQVRADAAGRRATVINRMDCGLLYAIHSKRPPTSSAASTSPLAKRIMNHVGLPTPAGNLAGSAA
jgi:hypothetical protein